MKKASMKKVFYLFAALGGIFFITITGCQKDKSKPENAPADVIKNSSTSTFSNSKKEISSVNGDNFRTIIGPDFPMSEYPDYYSGMKRGVLIARQKINSIKTWPPLILTDEGLKYIDNTKVGGIGDLVKPGTHVSADSVIEVYSVTPESTLGAYVHTDQHAKTQQELLDYFNGTPTAYWAGAYDGYVNFVYYGVSIK